MKLIEKAKANLTKLLTEQVQSVLYAAHEVVKDLMGEQAPERDDFLLMVKDKMQPQERSE